MSSNKVIGYAAAFLTTTTFVTQVVKVWSSGFAGDISMPMYVLFVLGAALWMVYGVITAAMPVVLANGVAFSVSHVGMDIET